jgi:membrane protease YdiL (CAAX protease family)
MQIKEHHRQSLKDDLRLGIIILAIISLVIAIRLVSLPLSIGVTALSFLVLLILTALYVLQGSPSLVKVTREVIAQKPFYLWFVPAALWIITAVYILFVGQLTIKVAAISLTYCFAPFLLFIPLRRQEPKMTWLDAVLIFFLWLPVEFGWLKHGSIPPVQSMANLYQLLALVITIFLYLVVRNLPDVGFSFRLKAKDWRTAIQSFIFFTTVALLIGLPTGFFAVSRYLLPTKEIIASFITIGFLVALPEEILFRGVIHNLIAKRLSGKKSGAVIALVISSIIFGLAHGNNPKPPFVNLDLGPAGIWHAPWAYMLIATLAGFAYGWTFIKTRKVTAAALVHVSVNWFWLVFFNG